MGGKFVITLSLVGALFVALGNMLPIPVATPGWDLLAQYEANSSAILQTGQAGSVSNWIDISGKGHTLGQGNVDAQPLYPGAVTPTGISAIAFNGLKSGGSGSWLHSPETMQSTLSGLTIFMVANFPRPTTDGSAYYSNGFLFGVGYCATGAMRSVVWGDFCASGSSSDICWQMSGCSADATALDNPRTLGVWRIWTTTISNDLSTVSIYDFPSGAPSEILLTSSAPSAPLIQPDANIFVGGRTATEFAKMDVAAIVVYHKNLDTTDRIAVRDYLYTKYIGPVPQSTSSTSTSSTTSTSMSTSSTSTTSTTTTTSTTSASSSSTTSDGAQPTVTPPPPPPSDDKLTNTILPVVLGGAGGALTLIAGLVTARWYKRKNQKVVLDYLRNIQKRHGAWPTLEDLQRDLPIKGGDDSDKWKNVLQPMAARRLITWRGWSKDALSMPGPTDAISLV